MCIMNGKLLHCSSYSRIESDHLKIVTIVNNTPSSCSCGHNFSVEHAFSCPTGGYPSIRHEIRDFTAHLLSEVCHNVAIEPHLQPLQGEALHNQSSNRQNGPLRHRC